LAGPTAEPSVVADVEAFMGSLPTTVLSSILTPSPMTVPSWTTTLLPIEQSVPISTFGPMTVK
jgi:hypothetical protein